MRLLERRKRELMGLCWPAFFATLPSYVALEKSVRRTRVGNYTICSVYESPDSWDIWIE